MATENKELRQLTNTVEIIGTLKSKDLEEKTSRAGNNYMSGSIIVTSKFDNKIQEIKIKVFIMKTSKLFKGIEKVKDEYKTIEDHGEEADRIRVSGEIDYQQFYNSTGNLNEYNEVKGVFFTRLTDENDQPDKALASLDVVVQGFEPVLDKDQLPTGDYKVKGFSVAWGNKVVRLMNTIVKEDLAQSFMDLYPKDSTGRLTLQLNNYVKKEEKEQVQAPAHGFGSTETVEEVVNDYERNYQVVGGDLPYFNAKEYTPEEIELAIQTETRTRESLQETAMASSTPQPTNTGFGQGSPMSDKEIDDLLPTNLGDDDLPDF